MTDQEYIDWLLDPLRATHRLALFELDHELGTVHLASKDWMSDTNIPYDGWIISQFTMEESVSASVGVGDVEAVNPDNKNLDWLSLNFYGSECRVYYGDDEWKRQDFRKIASATISECVRQSGISYKFNLVEPTYALSRPYVTTATNKLLTVEGSVNWLVSETSETILLTGIPEHKLSWLLRFYVGTETTLEETVRGIAASIGAYVRVGQGGNIEIAVPQDQAVATITEDDIAGEQFRMIETIPPYKEVVIVVDDGTTTSKSTGAETGIFDRTKTINTYLESTSNITEMLNEYASYYATNHSVWEASIVSVSASLQCADKIVVDHEHLVGSGVVTRIIRQPMTNNSKVEFEL